LLWICHEYIVTMDMHF